MKDSKIVESLIEGSADSITKHLKAASKCLEEAKETGDTLSDGDVRILRELQRSLRKMRNDLIFTYATAGVTQAVLAKSFGLTVGRVNQILKSYD